MNSAQALVLLLAVLAANLPFLTRRRFALISVRDGEKGLAWRLFELVVFYFLVGAVAALFESRAHGGVYAQGWAFYAITFCLFVVFAFPGFVACYLWRRREP